jgi:hypothetical protein
VPQLAGAIQRVNSASSIGVRAGNLAVAQAVPRAPNAPGIATPMGCVARARHRRVYDQGMHRYLDLIPEHGLVVCHVDPPSSVRSAPRRMR